MERIQTSTKSVDKFGAGKHGFTNGSPSTGTPSTQLDEAWCDSVQEEIANLIEAAGLTLDVADRAQLVNAIIKKGMQNTAFSTGTAGGSADAITSSYTPAVAALTNGMTLRVRAASANATTTPTFTPASGTIAAKTIIKGAGAALVAGDIAGDGHWIDLQYDSTLDRWVLLNPATGVSSAAAKASTAEITAESAVNKYISPDRLSSSKRVTKAWCNFDGTLSGTITPRASLNVSSVTKNGTGDYTVNFTSSLPDADYAIQTSFGGDSGASYFTVNTSITPPTTTSCRVRSGTTTSAGVDAVRSNITIHGN